MAVDGIIVQEDGVCFFEDLEEFVVVTVVVGKVVLLEFVDITIGVVGEVVSVVVGEVALAVEEEVEGFQVQVLKNRGSV